MRLSFLYYFKKTVPGHIFRGKRRLVKMVSKCASNTLQREYKIQDNNMLLLRHSYLSVDESTGHTKDLNKRAEIIKRWTEEKIKNKFKDHIKLEDRLLHLNVNKAWE